MTVAEWELLPEDDSGEVVDNVLVEEEAPDSSTKRSSAGC
jgi:hypothetical protein